MIERLPDDVVVFSNVAHLNISGCVNKQNMRYWSGVNPKDIQQRPIHCDRVSVVCSMENRDLLSFCYVDGRAVTLNSERYVAVIQEFFAQALELNALLVWFQQDGAKALTARESVAVLREMFSGRLISLRGDISWPARSPDLNCDYFFWGYLNTEVFKAS